MKLKVSKVSMKSLVTIMVAMNLVAGFILGAIITVISLTVPQDQGIGPGGAWAILIFPILNALMGLLTGIFLAGIYNTVASKLGGIILEYDESE